MSSAFDHVGYEVGAAAGEFFGEFFKFFSGADAVGEADFCACVDVTFCSFDGVVDAVDAAAKAVKALGIGVNVKGRSFF